jgi:hypothetical protein
MPSLATLVLALGLLIGLTSPAAAGDDDYVRWSLMPPSPGPWQLLRYEITRRPPATTAVHRRRLPTASETDHALGLLTPEESDAFFAAVRSLNPLALRSDPGLSPPARSGDDAAPTPPPKREAPAVAAFSCHLLLDGQPHAFAVREPAAHPDPSVRALFDRVVALVEAHAGDLPFRNVFVPVADRGWLNVESVPAARVNVDGLDTQLTTPVYGFELRAGSRRVTLTSLDGRLIRTYTPQVAPRGTTTLRVDLR